MPTKQVQQATFDAIVREAIEEFALTPEEALQDAREQLKKVGVTDFSNLITSIPTADNQHNHHGISLPIAIETALNDSQDSALIDSLAHLADSAAKDAQVCGVAGAHGAVLLAIRSLDYALSSLRQSTQDVHVQVAEKSCDIIQVLCSSNEVNRSKFITEKELDGVAILKNMLSFLNEKDFIVQSSDDSPSALDTCIALLGAIIAVQRKSENVKRKLAAGSSLDHLVYLLDFSGMHAVDPSYANSRSSAKLFRRGSSIIKHLLSPDDTTVQVSETFNRARALSGGQSVMESGLRPLSYPKHLPEISFNVLSKAINTTAMEKPERYGLITDCITNAKLCAISDEICAQIMSLGFSRATITILQQYSESVSISHTCLALLRNLAARDQCKTELYESMDVVSSTVTKHSSTSHTIVEFYAGLIASLCLRRPDLANKFVKSGNLDDLLSAMKKYEQRSSLQRLGCLALRNVCARDEDARQYLRSNSSAESIIRKAWKNFPTECDEAAYSALRDLDVLRDSEVRRDERYTMPAGFFSSKVSSEKCRW